MRNLIPYFIEQKLSENEQHGWLEAYGMFVDLSGFTALTQKLTQEGVSGAEKLSIILNRIFEPLVSMVYQQGGFIPYFAGDAFTAIFPYEQSEEAVTRLIATAQKASNAYLGQKFFGSFEIGIKVGLAHGMVEWGIVGDQIKGFYFRGEVIDRCAKAQTVASNRQIILHSDLKQQLPLDYTVSLVEIGHYLLKSNAKTLDLEPPILPDRVLSKEVVQQFYPDALIDLPDIGEFRTIVTVFISFEGLDNHQQLNQFATIIMERACNFSGYFKEIDYGDKGGVIPVFFGAPISYENNAERAVEFTLAVVEALKQAFNGSVRYRFGMTIGTAYTGFIGCADRCQYGVVGNQVNLAARLMIYADWGEILVDQGIQYTRQFIFKHKGNIHYKGIIGDIPTYSLLGRSTENSFSFEGNIIGRQDELDQLIRFIHPALDAQKIGIAYIYGEAGIGKSRLAYELRKILINERPLSWFVCKTDQILRKGLNPFIYFLKYYFSQSSDATKETNKSKFENDFNGLLKDLAEIELEESKILAQETIRELQRTKSVLAGMIGIHYPDSLWEYLDTKGRYQNIISSLTALFIGESILQPVVLFLEDGHWLDEQSTAFLNDFIRLVKEHAIFILVTSRYKDNQSKPVIVKPETIKENEVEQLEIDLNFFSEATIRNFAMNKLDGIISDDFHQLLIRTTNGNPFYLEQMLEYFQESNLIVEEKGEWTIKDRNIELSNSVNAILTARIDRLSYLVKETVKAAAVIGQEFELPVLSAVMKSQSEFVLRNGDLEYLLKEQIQQAEEGQIWLAVNELRYIFKHSLLREAVYSMQVSSRLKELHQRIAEAIETLYADNIKSRYLDLSFHYEQAGIPKKTQYYLRKAADLARRNFQNEAAIKHYSKLLRQLPEGEERIDILQTKGTLLERIGQWNKAKKAYEEALKIARTLNEKTLLGYTNNTYGKLLLLQGNYEDARLHLEVAATFFEYINDREGMSEVYGSLGNFFFRQGAYDDAKAYLTQSINLARQSDKIYPDPKIIGNLGLTYMNQADYEEGIRWQKEGIQLSKERNDQLGLANLYTSLGILCFEKGDYKESLNCHYKGLELSEELGEKQITAISIGCIGRIYERQGDYGKAMENYVKDLKICEELGDKQGKAIALGLIGDLHSVKGEFNEAIKNIEQGLSICRALGYQKGIAKAANTLGDIYYYLDNFEISNQYYDKAIEVTREIDQKLVLGMSLVEKGRTLLMWGKLEALQAIEKEAIELAENLGNPDLIYEATILAARSASVTGKQQTAIELISSLLKYYPELHQQATTYYVLAQIEPEQISHKEIALQLYQQLYEATPKFIYKRRIEKLKSIGTAIGN
ncbi:MAG: tetratricopeptide repeat protein [Bacteroidota bacterium]